MSKSKIMMVAGLGLGVVIVALLVMFALRPPRADTPVADTQSSAGRLQTALGFLEQLCLVDTEVLVRSGVGADLKVQIDALGARADAEQLRRVLRGAAQTLSEDAQLSENQRMGQCMDANLERMVELLLPPGERAAARLNPLETRFAMRFADPEDPAFVPDQIVMHLKGQRWVTPRMRLVRQPAGAFMTYARYPARGETVTGTLTRVLADERRGTAAKPARLCVSRPDPLTPHDQLYVAFACVEAEGCDLDETSPPLLAACAPIREVRRWPALLPAAHAQPVAEPVWSVPSSESWTELKADMKDVGYSAFTIETEAFQGTGTYAVEVALSVNGRPIYEDGLAPADRPVPYDGDGPFRYDFGFRTLDLQGVRGGCDELAVSLTPLGAQQGRPLTVRRDYVVLRPPRTLKLEAEGATVRWSGRYWRPADAFEHEVFIASVIYGDGQTVAGGDPAALAAARERIEGLKQRFDALGLSLHGDRLVGVIRPPLSRPSFGLAIGRIKPSGVLRFTFSLSDARSVKAYLEQAGQTGAPEARRILRHEPMIYAVGGHAERAAKQTPPGVCRI
ncbi:MAG: hypothetical protein ACFB22_06915 [Rhodothalassiaceae bacterium]